MDEVKFLFPIDGDVLIPTDGEVRDGILYINARISAPIGCSVTVNEAPCTQIGEDSDCGIYGITLAVDSYRSTLNAHAIKNGTELQASIRVFRFKKALGKYSIGIDDIIWSMHDLYINENVYTSLFDSPFFALFKRLHSDFGTKVQMNVYYTDITDHYKDGFNITMLSDKYKNEFIANSHWLRLTPHAHDDTAHIYRDAPYSVVKRDHDLVTKELIRIAGRETVDVTCNDLHYAETTVEGARALRDCGARCLVGYFKLDKNGVPIISYYLDPKQTLHVADRAYWVDTKEDIVFTKDNMVIDQFKVEAIEPRLDLLKNGHPSEMSSVRFVTHEQYFYSHYSHYMPDYETKIRTAVEWAVRNGYEAAFTGDTVAEDIPY